MQKSWFAQFQSMRARMHRDRHRHTHFIGRVVLSLTPPYQLIHAFDKIFTVTIKRICCTALYIYN